MTFAAFHFHQNHLELADDLQERDPVCAWKELIKICSLLRALASCVSGEGMLGVIAGLLFVVSLLSVHSADVSRS